MRSFVETVVDGIKYLVVESDASPDGFTRYDLKRWVSTFGTSGAWHSDTFVLLPADSTINGACARFFGRAFPGDET